MVSALLTEDIRNEVSNLLGKKYPLYSRTRRMIFAFLTDKRNEVTNLLGGKNTNLRAIFHDFIHILAEDLFAPDKLLPELALELRKSSIKDHKSLRPSRIRGWDQVRDRPAAAMPLPKFSQRMHRGRH